MKNETGSPEAQVIIYAIARGEYDQQLTKILLAIQRRRDTADRVGIIIPAVGDWVEMFEDELAPAKIRSKKLRVLGFTKDKQLRCRAEEIEGIENGAIVKIRRDWVYRVHYYT